MDSTTAAAAAWTARCDGRRSRPARTVPGAPMTTNNRRATPQAATGHTHHPQWDRLAAGCGVFSPVRTLKCAGPSNAPHTWPNTNNNEATSATVISAPTTSEATPIKPMRKLGAR